jgi:hypothetical protein
MSVGPKTYPSNTKGQWPPAPLLLVQSWRGEGGTISTTRHRGALRFQCPLWRAWLEGGITHGDVEQRSVTPPGLKLAKPEISAK